MKAYKFFLGLLLCVCFAAGCKDKNKDSKPHFQLDPEFKSYFVNGSVGTKYIYVDTGDNNLTEIAEIIEIREIIGELHEDYTSENYVYEWKDNLHNLNSLSFDIRRNEHRSSFIIHAPPFGSGQGITKTGNDWGPECCVRKLDSVEIFGTTYYDVLESNQRTLTYYDKLWFAKDVGIIAKFSSSNSMLLKEIQ
ncbi:MAG: hypothetical protein WD077_03280 [Bacteroidia bacterium]